MKKSLIYLSSILIIVFFDVIISQITPYFIKPNVWLIYVIFVALFFNHTASTIIGFTLGIIADFLHLNIFGLQTMILSTLGYLLGWLNTRVNENFIKVQVLILFIASLLYILFYILLSNLLNIEKGNIIYFILSPILNSIFGIFIIQFFIWYYKKWKLI